MHHLFKILGKVCNHVKSSKDITSEEENNMGTYRCNIDWYEYKRLKRLGLKDEKIARIFGISRSCLFSIKKRKLREGNKK